VLLQNPPMQRSVRASCSCFIGVGPIVVVSRISKSLMHELQSGVGQGAVMGSCPFPSCLQSIDGLVDKHVVWSDDSGCFGWMHVECGWHRPYNFTDRALL